MAGSRFTTEAESRYAPIEGEALALVHGLESCRIVVLGCPNLLVSVDHKPLHKTFDNRPIESIRNPRIQSLKERAMLYRFSIKHTAGALHLSVDATSRYPAPHSPPSADAITTGTHGISLNVDDGLVNYLSARFASDNLLRAITWDRVMEAASTDTECRDH